MAVVFNREDMAYRVESATGFAFPRPKHKTFKRVYLNAGSMDLSDPDQPSYQTIDWAYDPDWIQQYALELTKVHDYRYTVKRKFDGLPEVALGEWNPTVECLQYTEDTTIWIENRWAEFDVPSGEWKPSVVMGEWQNIPEYQAWADGSRRFPFLLATEDTQISSLFFISIPPNGTYTIRQLKEQGYAYFVYNHPTARIALSTAIKPT